MERLGEKSFFSPIYIYERRGYALSTYFVDEYERQLDDRGRIILPSKLRDKVLPCVYITRSPSEKCLHMYNSEGWEAMSSKLKELPTSTDPSAAAFVRLFFGKATECEIDKQGRVSISPRLAEFAGLKKDIVLVGANTRMEIWDKEEWNKYQEGLESECLAEGILRFGLNI